MSGSTSTANSTTSTSTTASTGNTILPPPRLTGNPQADAIAMQRWLNLLYDQMIVVSNVIGQITTDETKITTLQGNVTTLQAEVAKLNTFAGITS